MHIDPSRANPRPLASRCIVPAPSSDKPRFRSTAYREFLARVQRFARVDRLPVLIEGESGTGKTWIAAYIHQLSPRAAQPYQPVTLSALSDSLAESELFGHVAGAFTDGRRPRGGLFASASRGTLFLDELGKASSRIQQLLLQVVEYGEMRPVGSDRSIRVDTRLVAATNVPLPELVARGAFLPDLRARLGLFRVQVPPLRERRADIPLLVSESLAQHASSFGYEVPPRIDPELMDALKAAEWPDNLRELDATVLRLLIDANGKEVLSTELCTGDLSHLSGRRKPKPGSLHLCDIEAAITRVGDKSKAARLLAVDRRTVQRIIERERKSTTSSGSIERE